MKKELWIWVVNRGDNIFVDRFDSEEYVFEPGNPVEIPAAAAKLIFGWGEPDKARCLQRLGWARSNQDIEAGTRKLNQFSFHTERPRDGVPPPAPVGAQAPGPTLPSGGSGAVSAEPRAPRTFQVPPGRMQPAP